MLCNNCSSSGFNFEKDEKFIITFGEASIVKTGDYLTDDLTVSNPLGKYKMNEVIPKGTKFEAIFRGVLSKTYTPTLTDPSLSIGYSSAILMKVGAEIASQKATLNFSRGSINPQYTAESPYRSGEATGYSIMLSGASVEYSDSGTESQFTVPAFTRNSPGNVAINASVDYAEGVQPKDSDGNDYSSPLPAGSKGASKMIEFILPFYYGVSDTETINSFSGFTENLTKKGTKTYKFTTNAQHVVVAYDASYGDLTSIKDRNDYDYITGFNKSTLVVEGQTYNVYVQKYKTTDTEAPYTFRF